MSGSARARPAAAADRLLLLQGAMPILHAPPQRRQRPALEREAIVFLLGGADEVDQVVHLRERGRIAREETRHLPPEGGGDRVVA